MSLYKDKFKIVSNRLQNWDYSSEAVYFITLLTRNRKCLFGSVEDEKMVLNDNGKIIENELLKSIKIRKNWFFHNWIVMPNHIHLLIEIQNSDVSIETQNSNAQIVDTHNVETHGSASTSSISEPINVAETDSSPSLQNQSLSKFDKDNLETQIVETHGSASTSSISEALNVAKTDSSPSLQNQPSSIFDKHNVETHGSASTSSISERLNVAETDSSPSLQNQSLSKFDTHNVETQIVETQIVETHGSASSSSISVKKNETESKLGRKSNSISSFVAIFKSITTKQINGVESIWQTNYHDHIVRNYKTFDTIYNYIKENPRSWDTDSINSNFQ